MPGKGRTRAEVQLPKARAAIARKVCTIDIGRARSRAHCCGRIGVTAGQAGAPLAEATIEPGEDATKITSDIGGGGVAVHTTPSADPLRPSHETRRVQRRHK